MRKENAGEEEEQAVFSSVMRQRALRRRPLGPVRRSEELGQHVPSRWVAFLFAGPAVTAAATAAATAVSLPAVCSSLLFNPDARHGATPLLANAEIAATLVCICIGWRKERAAAQLRTPPAKARAGCFTAKFPRFFLFSGPIPAGQSSGRSKGQGQQPRWQQQQQQPQQPSTPQPRRSLVFP